MIQYIKQYAKLVIDSADERSGISQTMRSPPRSEVVIDAMTGIRELAKELDRLDPRDFEPSAQLEFVRVRGNIIHICRLSNYTKPKIQEVISPLLPVIDQFRGPGSAGVTRQFGYITDAPLRGIIERDYAELAIKLFPSGAWKSAVIIAGSILEAVLFDRLADVKWATQAKASSAAKDSKGNAIKPDDWKLCHLIDIAVEIKLLPKDPADTIHRVLRDYRNFVHPKKEVRASHACTEAEAMLSFGALNSVCNYIEKHP
jgi:hypothetical protein